MMDFKNPDPDTMYNPLLREASRYYKKTPEGVKKMCEIFNEIRREGIEIGIKKGEKKGEKKGVKQFSTLIKKLSPDSEDYQLALNANRSQREALYAKYGIE